MTSSSYVVYSQLNSLEEFGFIGGNEYTLVFNAFDSDGVTPLDLGGATIKWVLSPYGQADYTILQKTGTITGTNTFEISLTGNDTRNLNGKFIQQPILYSFLGNEYRPGQGVILILPSIEAS